MCDCQDYPGDNSTCPNCTIFDNIEMDYYLTKEQEKTIFNLIIHKNKYSREAIENKLIDMGFFTTISRDIAEQIKNRRRININGE